MLFLREISLMLIVTLFLLMMSMCFILAYEGATR